MLMYHDEPLKNYNLLQSNDVDESQEIVSSMYCKHSLIPLNGDTVDAKLNAIKGDYFNFGFLTYGVNANIDLPPLESCYHVNITLSGESIVDNKKGLKLKTWGMKSGAVLLPGEQYHVIWKDNTRQYAFKFPKKKLEKHLSSLIYEDVNSRINFETVFDLNSAAGRGLIRACSLLQKEWEEKNVICLSPIARRQLESYVMTSFLIAAKNPYSEKLLFDYKAKDLNEQLVRRVINYVEEHAHELPSLTDLTSYAGVSARTLQLAFKRYLNMSPMQYVQKVRLKRAHEHIIQARHTGEKITNIAMTWGFYNPGRFSQLYKQHYGCTPKETLFKKNLY